MRVVIAEDNVLLSSGLELLLAAKGCDVVAVVGDGEAFRDAVAEHRPDIAIVDVRLPPSFRDEGIHAALRARREHGALPILVLSQYVEREYAGELLSDGRGGIGYLLKDRIGRVAEFVDALRRVAAGGTAMDPEVIAQLLARRAGDPLDTLTSREREALALMAQGHDNATIAERMRISDNARPQAHRQHLHQARPGTGRLRPPPRAGSARLPGRRAPGSRAAVRSTVGSRRFRSHTGLSLRPPTYRRIAST